MQYHQKDKPEIPNRDRRGVLIQTSLRVAYNRSGDIETGTIIEVRKNDWKIARKGVDDKFWWSHQFEMLIKNEIDEKITTVKNYNSFLII